MSHPVHEFGASNVQTTVVKNAPASAENAGDAASIPGSGRSPGGGHGPRSLDGCSPQGLKESDMTE